MKSILVLFISIATLFSCSTDDNENNPSELKIRISNASQYDFENIVVNTTTGNVHFENLKSGQKSEYKVFAEAYRYAFVELEIDGETYTFQPIDYFGESLLEDGNYTYQLDASEIDERFSTLSLTLLVD